jgi:iron complex transport system ATP-binding protein
MGWIGDGDFRSAEAGRVTRARLNDCGIAHLAGRTFNTLSGGEQQRAHFARSLVQIWRRNGDCRPRYLLLDEPTSNLDLVHQQRILELARRQARNGIGVMVVLHDLNLAARYADRVALLKAGRLVCCGPMVEALNATVLSDTYETDVHVEHHHKLGRLVVLT